MYLMAEQRVKKGSAKYEAIQAGLSQEHRSNLEDEDYGYEAYVSGWNFPDSTMVPEPLYQLLINVTGMQPTPESPHFTILAETGEEGDYLVQACCAYWRKANQIHHWFVEQIQNGVDEGQTSRRIHGEELADLVDRCKQVLETPLLAAKLLPTEAGFFFGSTDYDEWYIGDLKRTVTMLTEVFESYPKPLVLRYRASW